MMAEQDSNIDFVWNFLNKTFNIDEKWEREGDLDANADDFEDLNVVCDLIVDYELQSVVRELLYHKIRSDFRAKFVPELWSTLTNEEYVEDYQTFPRALQKFQERLETHSPILELLGKVSDEDTPASPENGTRTRELATYQMYLHGALLAQLELGFDKPIRVLYEKAFICHAARFTDPDESGDMELQCHGCGEEMEHCYCSSIFQAFKTSNKILLRWNLLERLCLTTITQLIRDKTEEHVRDTCQGSFQVPHLEPLETWLEEVVISWLKKVFDSVETKFTTTMNVLHKRLTHFLYEAYTHTRRVQLFNIIIEYPDSIPALEDLNQCLARTHLTPVVVSSLKTSLETRLLHPGVNTTDVLTAYISAIKALRVLDPSGVILDTVSQPVRQYLRGREDTVRCILSSLTEDGGGGSSDLAEELCKGAELGDAETNQEHEGEEDMSNWDSWRPDPVEANPDPTLYSSRKRPDLISTLVNIYGSKELFVHEYRTLLADRLLSQTATPTLSCLQGYEAEREIRYLELLKLRFGEAQLHNCEVMLKDVTDSRRMNTQLQGLSQKQTGLFPVQALVLSAQFWPSFKEEKLELPEFIQDELKKYTEAFQVLKGSRTLHWKPHLGVVHLELELKDRTLEFTVTPTQATIIYHFQEQSEWKLEDLAKVMGMPTSLLRRRITFWQSQGFLKETSTDVFLLVEEGSAGRGHKGSTSTSGPDAAALHLACEEECESAMASSQSQREEELSVFWSYIVGMLTNLDSLPLERIHQMLKMFAMQGPSGPHCDVDELRAFLDVKVREHKLLFSGGLYRLPKP